MGSISFALSISHFINSVGADAGFASIVGLAILVLLYFAQARETATLREQLDDAGERVHQLESRLVQLHRGNPQASSPVAAPADSRIAPPAPAPTAAAGPAGAVASEPQRPEAPVTADVGAPAGVGAPALSAATRLIPGGSESGATAVPEGPAEQTAVTPPPVTAAGAGNGSGARAAATPPPIQIRPGGGASVPRRPPPPLSSGGSPGGRRRGVIGAVAALLAAAAVVVALLLITSGGSGSSASRTEPPASNAPVAHHRKPPVSAPAPVTVAVLNGTATSGLAHRVAVKLGDGGFRQATVATATDQTRSTTTVSYLPGHQRDAQAVAASLKLSRSAVAPIDANTKAVACPPPGSCAATVVVTVGADLANTP